MFQILPVMVCQLAERGFAILPVEIIAGILRYLDSESLLNAVKAYKVCKDVSIGDPILRRRLRMLLKQKKKVDVDRRINPALGVTITRRESGKMFGKNLEKNISVQVFTNPDCPADIQRLFSRYGAGKAEDNAVALPASKRCNYRL